MLSALLPVPASAVSAHESVRPVARAVEVTPVAPPTPVDAGAANLQYRRSPQPDAAPAYEPPSLGTTFAAAVLSGALAPTPKTLSQLYARIGGSTIPESSELRLRDLEV